VKTITVPYLIINLETGARLPKLNHFTHIVILEGPMNVFEEDGYPCIKDAIQRGKSVLGICLSAQFNA